MVWLATLICFVSILLLSSLMLMEGVLQQRVSRLPSRMIEPGMRLLRLALGVSLASYAITVAGLFVFVLRAALA